MAVSQPQSSEALSAEHQRLAEANQGQKPWRRWGPYLSERQWGTVREDDSPDGNAWESFSHDQARSRAYQWGEDGLGGISDDRQLLCFALALWNGKDPILKERLFGLTNSEGNHGEDVKEYYYYLGLAEFRLRAFRVRQGPRSQPAPSSACDLSFTPRSSLSSPQKRWTAPGGTQTEHQNVHRDKNRE